MPGLDSLFRFCEPTWLNHPYRKASTIARVDNAIAPSYAYGTNMKRCDILSACIRVIDCRIWIVELNGKWALLRLEERMDFRM